MTNIEHLQYPIGKFVAPAVIEQATIAAWITEIAGFPADLRAVALSLNEAQLASVYRPGGWTLRQVIHHLADSHTNAYIRFKLALTEENPTVKPYFEERWAETEDGKNAPIALSLQCIEAIHGKLSILLKSFTPETFYRTYYHPEHALTFELVHMLGTYAWHGKHHLAQIQNAITTK